jgi:uncharacterized protein YjiS (DUF1127 family)
MYAGGCSGADVLSAVGLAAERVRATVNTWAGRSERRHAALAIDAHTLDDIGLCRGLVTLEAAKPFWRA